MKKIVISFLMLSFLSVVVFSSCKKYEDGPAFSLKSKKNRLTGDWEFEKMTITSGGTTDDLTAMYAGCKFVIKEDGTGTFQVPGELDDNFTWEFSDDKEEFEINFSGDQYKWTILKLKNKELWFEQNVDGDIMEMHLKQ